MCLSILLDVVVCLASSELLALWNSCHWDKTGRFNPLPHKFVPQIWPAWHQMRGGWVSTSLLFKYNVTTSGGERKSNERDCMAEIFNGISFCPVDCLFCISLDWHVNLSWGLKLSDNKNKLCLINICQINMCLEDNIWKKELFERRGI